MDRAVLEPVWGALERYWKPTREKRAGATGKSGMLHLCQAKSNRGPRGRKNDFADGERVIKRLVAQELILSFVPDTEQRLWRTVTRRKHQLTQDKVRFQNRRESLWEPAHMKLSSFVSDLPGLSARRMLQAIAEGETDAAKIAALADNCRRATPGQLREALGACTELHIADCCRGRWRNFGLEAQIEQLEQEASRLLREHQDAVQRVAEVPGFGVDSALQMIAEVGPTAAAFTFGEGAVFLGGSNSPEAKRAPASPKVRARPKATEPCGGF